jgi:isopenicillin-N N-acyltransferase-like protein
MRVIELAGNPYDMGRQHAYQVRDLRAKILESMGRRLESLERYEIDLQPYVAELYCAWEEIAWPTLEMLRGMAEGLEFEWGPFFRYTVASFLEDRVQCPADGEGCTVWAASGPVTRYSLPILAKNRDYRPEHQFLPCLARACPADGLRYIYATSAGSPAVFSSGMNEAGLAAADTRVNSLDIGPGLARYSAMMDILEHHADVASALDYLREVPHIGDGTLTLIDRTGASAVFEAGRSAQNVIRTECGFVVSTNHYSGPRLRDRWVDRNPWELRGNSQNRYTRVVAALEAARGYVDAPWAQALMADHGGSSEVARRGQHAICRHADTDPQSITISTALYLPQERVLLFADGQPCQTPFQAWPLI